MMRHWRVYLETEQALIIQNKPGLGGNESESAPFIPGRSLRGAFAAAYLEREGQESADSNWFQRVFVGEEVRFSPLYPLPNAATSETEKAEKSSEPSELDPRMDCGPFPRTARSCKRWPGFGGGMDSGYGVWDALFELFPSEVLAGQGGGGKKAQPPTQKEECQHRFVRCKLCDSEFRRISDFWSSSRELQQKRAGCKSRAATSLVGRTGIDSRLESAEQSRLYFTHALAKNSRFAGTLSSADPELVAPLLAVESLRLGSQLTRGHGKSKLSFHELPNSELGERLKQFQDLLPQAVIRPHDCQYFTIDLLSPLLLCDRYLRDRFGIQPDDLVPFGPELKWELLAHWTAPARIANWNSAWRMPQISRNALCAGSVILGRVRGERDGLIRALKRLEDFGLGERTGEGFGHLSICHPFHLNFKAKEPKHEQEKRTVSRK